MQVKQVDVWFAAGKPIGAMSEATCQHKNWDKVFPPVAIFLLST
jgi:hypothetical protein